MYLLLKPLVQNFLFFLRALCHCAFCGGDLGAPLRCASGRAIRGSALSCFIRPLRSRTASPPLLSLAQKAYFASNSFSVQWLCFCNFCFTISLWNFIHRVLCCCYSVIRIFYNILYYEFLHGRDKSFHCFVIRFAVFCGKKNIQ